MIDVTWPWLFIVLPLPWVLRYVLPRAKQAPGQASRKKTETLSPVANEYIQDVPGFTRVGNGGQNQKR